MKSAKNLIPTLLIGFILGAVVMGGVGAVLGAQRDGEAVSKSDVKADVETAAVLQTLDAQVLAWNSGDIEGFMQDYLKSDALRFASGGDIETGWDGTLARYQSRYPDRSAMGRLEFSDREVKILTSGDALIFGRWTLIRDADRPTGLFTLHMKKHGGRWVIISDHTSSAR